MRRRGARPPCHDDELGPPYEVLIGFETHEPLIELAERLREAGLSPTVVTDDREPRIELTDPDGEDVQIHPAP